LHCIQFGDEWIIEGVNVYGEVKDTQPQDEVNAGGSSSNPSLNTSELNRVLVHVDDAHLSMSLTLIEVMLKMLNEDWR